LKHLLEDTTTMSKLRD